MPQQQYHGTPFRVEFAIMCEANSEMPEIKQTKPQEEILHGDVEAD